MRTGNDLFFSISGQRHTNRTELYNELKKVLPGMFPEEKFEFLGNPFNRLPFPLTWGDEVCSEPATSRLLGCWQKLDTFCYHKLRTLLGTNAVIFTHGFGLDALVYATACACEQDQNDEAFRLHNGLVKLRLKEQHIPAPEYFLTRANIRTLDARITAAYPELAKRYTQPERLRFIRYEERTIHSDYFERIGNQKPPHYIEADETVEDMVHQVVRVLERRLRMREAA